MPIDTIQLPKDKTALARVIDQHAEREASRLSYRRTMWLLAWYYLNGARRFDVFDPLQGTIHPHYMDEEGNMEFQSQELLSAIDKVSARLASMNLMPKVYRKGTSLSAIRDRSVAQIILNSITSEDQLEKVKTQFAHLYTTLGSCGISGHIVDHETIGLTTDLEVIHPRELFPFPSLGNDYTKQRGIMRQRSVPISFLKEVFGKKVVSNVGKMEYWEKMYGEGLEESEGAEGGTFAKYNDEFSAPRGTGSEDKTSMGVARIRELWLYGTHNIVSRYIVTSGDYVLTDESYEGLEVFCPIGFARFMETGSFHGSGLFDLLFSISRELEKLMKQLFNNVRDQDRYGVLVMPQGQMNERQMLRDVGKGLRVMPWEPDPVSEGFRPFAIQPFNTGDVPGKTAGFARNALEGLNPIRDLIREKGRVDSAAGLSFLDEQVNRAMTNPTRGIELAFGTCYQSMLSSANRVIMTSPRALPLNELTLDMAGAIFDRETGTVSFQGANPIPSATNLKFGVQERSPRSMVARKQEAMELLKSGVTDPDALKIFALQEGLDFAMYMEEERASYQTVIENCLRLFGDGQDPGEIVVTPHTASPKLQLRVVTAFMTSPTMAVSSPEVQDEFMKYRQFLMDSMGMTLPEAVPNPDDMAILLQAEQAMQEQMMQMQMQQQQQGQGAA
jgi:hypothetical protein